MAAKDLTYSGEDILYVFSWPSYPEDPSPHVKTELFVDKSAEKCSPARAYNITYRIIFSIQRGAL